VDPLALLLARFIPADLGLPNVASLTAYLQAQLDAAQSIRPVLLIAAQYQLTLASGLSQAMVVLMRQPDSRKLGDSQVTREMGLRMAALRGERRVAYQALGLPVPGDPNLVSGSQDVWATFANDPYGRNRGPW